MDLSRHYEDLDLIQVERYVVSSQEENLHLDFKTVADADVGRDDRRNLAIALSGFANSEGGLIVWGVDARANEDGIDCVCGMLEIKSLSTFLSKLNEYTSQLVSPIVDGVLHRKIPSSEDRGFAVTLIPESVTGPHMAKGQEYRYYKRSGSSFMRMEHFELEDMFGRRKKPRLRVRHKIVPTNILSGGGQATTRNFLIILQIENSGRGPACAPWLEVSVNAPYRVYQPPFDGPFKELLKRHSDTGGDGWIKFGGTGDVLIHPKTSLDATALAGKLFDGVTPPTDVKIDYKVAAEDTSLIEDTITIPTAELGRAIGWRPKEF